MQPTLIVITGPTAVGKTGLSVKLAEHLNTSIISTDSRQFYREMSVGTAKPTEAELNRVPHYFIDNRSVTDYYSAGDFEREALYVLDQLFTEGKKQVIAIGGSGLYVKALCEGLDEMPPANLEFRNFLISGFNENGISWLQEMLKDEDKEAFERIDIRNPQRIMRALELKKAGGIKKKEVKQRPFRIRKLGLDLPREVLYQRINQRVSTMIENGLVDEVKSLVPLKHLNALQTVGYTEIFDYLDGKTDLNRAIELIRQHTRNYAKRQLTWFKADPEIAWFSPDNEKEILEWLNE